MRVLLINSKLELAAALARRDEFNVAVLEDRATARSSDLPALQRLTYRGGQKFSLRAAWGVRRAIQCVQPDIIHAFYARALAHTVLATTWTTCRAPIISYRGISSRLSRWDAGDAISYAHSRVSAHACESEAVRQAMVESGVSPDDCYVTYNCMLNPPAQRPGRSALAALQIPADAFVVGTMATMRPVKGIDILLQAAIECRHLQDVHFLLLGRVADARVAQLAADPRIRDRVHLVGHHARASELISGVDVFAMPSRSEALSQALLEAMYQGICPLVSDAGGMPEAVRHNQDGLVVPRGNVSALAEAICRLHGDRELIARYAKSARERVTAEFSVDRMAERTAAMYHAVLDKARTAPHASAA